MRNIFNKIKSFKLTKTKIIIIVVVLIVIALFQWNKSQKSIVVVSVSEVTKGDLIETVSASGEITAEKRANLSFPTSGKLSTLKVKEGDVVKKNQYLAALDRTVLDASYQQALSTLRKYDATIANVYDSLKGKSTTETFSERDTRTSAETLKDSAWDSVRIAEYNLKNAVLYSPFNGIVTNFASGLSEGVNTVIGTTIFTVVDPETTYFDAEVSEMEVNLVKVGMEVGIELDAFPDEILNGQVKTISFGNYTSSTGGNVYKVKISLPDNTDMKFKLGMKGNAKIVIHKNSDVTKVSLDALVENGEKYVWLVKDNKIAKRIVKTEASSDSETIVLEGLSAGDKVVLTPPVKLNEGQKVKVK